jgi:hypothetical protein
VQAFKAAVAERVTWRLNQYMDRHEERLPSFNVIPGGSRRQKRNRACVMFGEDSHGPLDVVPRNAGWQPVLINGELLYGKFVKVALNVLRLRPVDSRKEPNLLTDQLVRLFNCSLENLLDGRKTVTVHRRDDGTYVLNRGGAI